MCVRDKSFYFAVTNSVVLHSVEREGGNRGEEREAMELG